jgi:hypothetical protein
MAPDNNLDSGNTEARPGARPRAETEAGNTGRTTPPSPAPANPPGDPRVILAAARHATFVRRFNRGEPLEVQALSLGTILALVVAALGLALAFYLIRL